jgi:hypothetical protein
LVAESGIGLLGAARVALAAIGVAWTVFGAVIVFLLALVDKPTLYARFGFVHVDSVLSRDAQERGYPSRLLDDVRDGFRARLPSSANLNGAADYLIIGEIMICWERKVATMSDRGHVRKFDFVFPNGGFAETPTIVDGIHPFSNGYQFAIYDHETTATRYSGRMQETSVTRTDDVALARVTVEMEYMAIGRTATR